MIGSRFAHLIVAGFVSLAIALPVSSQEFPSRTVKIVMGFVSGGLGDIAGRAIGGVMSKSIGQQVMIEKSAVVAAAAAGRA
ncbi:MAG: hypothetical protein WCG92_15205, partial [Hyphomicrobiales bacterium]